MNLTGFGQAFDAINDKNKGRPLELNVGDVAEDPHQPRKEFDQAALQELADGIAERGVKTPISVHPDPARPGKYVINHGARRLRASLLCGKLTIPAFIDEVYDGYDQVIENIQREGLTPMELAIFIRKQILAGDKKGDIAKKLGKGVQTITEHLALLDAPACIEQAYASGVTSPKTLYDLRRLHEQSPAEVDEWCAGMPEISRKSVADLAAKLRHDVISAQSQDEELRHDVISESETVVVGSEKLRHDVISKRTEALEVPQFVPGVEPGQDGKLRHDVKKFGQDQKTKLVNAAANVVMTKKTAPSAFMRVRHNGRLATVASHTTLIIVYENMEPGDNKGTAEVQLGEVEVISVGKI